MPEERLSVSKREQKILAEWEEKQIFEKSLAKEAPKGNFVFFEGPPTANGKPGIHHAEARAFKDLIPRFKTMQGYHVDRKGGWDTHGLPVELEVEKQLGFKNKLDIEAYGIEAFNQKCRESVWTYLEDWKEFTRRLGFWVDLKNAYVTYAPEYVESLWWVIKQIWDKGLLYKDYRVTPHCPRCGTSLSSHELAQGYKEATDPAVYVKFKVTKGMDGKAPTEPEFLVAWTTTPWTLPANVVLAVNEDIEYVVVKNFLKYGGNQVPIYENLIIAKDIFESLYKRPDEDYLKLAFNLPYACNKLEGVPAVKRPEIVRTIKGKDLVGMEYEPLYPFTRELMKGTSEEGKKAWYVVPADFVSTADGSGIVHTAVMYGVDDFNLGTKIGLPKVHLVGLDGKFVSAAGPFAGKFVKSADADVVADLESRSLLLGKGTIEHVYPFCWRCKTPLLYYAKDSWYISMNAVRETLISENKGINWEPKHIQEGRFGEWIREPKDWAFSRERYWGTPLPVWVCEACGEKQCIGSFAELREKAITPMVEPFDPHRPFVDFVLVKCETCGKDARRVTDVCDVWFDSGCMPFAEWHYPFENKEKIDSGAAFPADFISEAIDQTRGWFYTLLSVSVLLGRGRPYKNVICLGHILDAKGKKMSKSLGNIVEPMEMIEKYGADAVRWYMYTVNQPGESKRFDEKALADMVKKVFNILGNVVNFSEMYSGEGKTSEMCKPTHVLDRWVLARLQMLARDVTKGLEQYQVTEPARNIASFIDELSTWWLRRSRDRFKGDDQADGKAAIATLQACLMTLSKLMAPFVPFMSEEIYGRIGGTSESVHLEAWPDVDDSLLDETLVEEMGQVRSIVSKALERRADAGRNVRQALASMTVSTPSGELRQEFVNVLKDEVNVHEVVVKKDDYAVELDVNLTPELVREGTVREMIRRVNAMRKEAKLTVQDRIELFVESQEPEIAKAIEEHKDELVAGVLGASLRTSGNRPEVNEEFRVNEFDMVIGFTKK